MMQRGDLRSHGISVDIKSMLTSHGRPRLELPWQGTYSRTSVGCSPAAPKAPPGPGGSPSPVVASVYADSSTMGPATRPPAIAAVPAGPTDSSDDAARTATAVCRRGKLRAAAREAAGSRSTAQQSLMLMQREEIPRGRRGTCMCHHRMSYLHCGTGPCTGSRAPVGQPARGHACCPTSSSTTCADVDYAGSAPAAKTMSNRVSMSDGLVHQVRHRATPHFGRLA